MPPHMQKAFYSLVEEYAPGTSDGMMGGDKDKVRSASRRVGSGGAGGAREHAPSRCRRKKSRGGRDLSTPCDACWRL